MSSWGAIGFELWSAAGRHPRSEEDLLKIPEPFRTHTANMHRYGSEPAFLDRVFRFNLDRMFDALERFMAEQA